MLSTSESHFPLGLPNIGASCWLNATLQLLFYSSNFFELVEHMNHSGTADVATKCPLHYFLFQMLHSLQTRQEPHQIVSKYRELHTFIISQHPTFASNALNDAHEVITFIINRLHEESGQEIPLHVKELIVDPVSKVILRDFPQISLMLECCMGVISRDCKDGTKIFETFTTLFVDPLNPDTQQNDIQEALHRFHFHSFPRSLFISLIIHPEHSSCMLPDQLFVAGTMFLIRGIIFFLPHMQHYIAAVRGTMDNISGWCIFNDANVSFLRQDELQRLHGAQPTLILYEQNRI